MADRMSRVWSPSTNVGWSVLPNAGYVEATLAPSLALQIAQDRVMRDWTVTRILMTLQFISAGTSQLYYGIRVANENEVPGNLTPGTDQTADWMLWGGLQVDSITLNAANCLNIDNRSQRKSRGMESELRLYLYNAGPDTSYMAYTARTLLLVP